MPVSISDLLHIDPLLFEATGAFDAVLDVDSRLFIDPKLLQTTEAPELQESYENLKKTFSDILKLLSLSEHRDDIFWNQAFRTFRTGEIKGLCIGYSTKGTSGSGIGRMLRGQILDIAKKIVDVGIKDPEVFELIGLFQEGVGADRLSDMTASIILHDLLNYSQRVFLELAVPTRKWTVRGQEYRLPRNPFNKHPIILVPKDILRDLPIAYGWSDIDIVAQYNDRLRQKVNRIIGMTWKQATTTSVTKKSVLRDVVIREPGLLEDLLSLYREKPATKYDFDDDPAGQIKWYRAARQCPENFPLELTLPPLPTAENVQDVVVAICEKFKDLVENNKLYELLYEKDGHPKKEEAAQLLFYGIADAYCEANNLDLSREANAGRGPVDFKVSSGYKKRVVVEVKLTSNSRLEHGLSKQLAEYRKAEKTHSSIYLVVDVIPDSRRKIRRLNELIIAQQIAGHDVPKVIYVDARPKASASKY